MSALRLSADAHVNPGADYIMSLLASPSCDLLPDSFMIGRAVVCVARSNERVYNFVGREMLQGGIAALAHPIFTAAETLQLIRDILAQQLATSPGPRQVHPLLSVDLHSSLQTLVSDHL